MMRNEFGTELDRAGYAPSIMQGERCVCASCGRSFGFGMDRKLDRHEPWGGTANRAKSKALGMWVYLCHFGCHEGPGSVHGDAALARRFRKDAQRAAMLRYGWSREEFMQKVKELLEREEKARRESEAEAQRAQIEAELKEIHRLDPSINTTEDLLKMPAAKEFYAYVRRGNTLVDAFYLANRERLAAAAAETARQQTMSASRSKDHLQSSGASRGAGADSVPAEEMQLFKLLNPTATEVEIQKYYNRSRA